MNAESSVSQTPRWFTEFAGQASESGFTLLGVCPVVDANGFHSLVDWIEAGYAAGMDYFANRIDAYRSPTGVMVGAKSIAVLASPYPAAEREACQTGSGRVARYAWSGTDYHDVIHKRIKALKKLVQSSAPEVSLRGCVDTAPLLERELAELAGLGWRGKNTLLLHREQGSYFFLACVLFDQVLPYDTPQEKSYCGSCTACLDACPTDAFVQEGTLNAGRCISYLTIEHRGSIDPDLRSAIGDWVFGCDVCQEVCPWNRKPSRQFQASEDSFPTRSVDLIEILEMDEETFRQRYRKSPFWRTRLQGMQRNAAIVLGNQRNQTAVSALERHLHSEDHVVAEACAWAIAQMNPM
ncbi:tRNA epoxyqueuosine(34) reductase QueG [Roseiconus lacunae]|uniref:tRNA epoxyqueuosine(34) reductase QueG n=1 Tax=Roseiconus lacunae TaxID=2605694 RepID=A0ABT7PE33_9BACT|nr:tRNA epoxyqueuosine(34) reductase QueG [Roseiconus lacunae]MDM4014752.1 tRNA epoxyqueuosine(34) reductase QueG [Roseiconus lacunae]